MLADSLLSTQTIVLSVSAKRSITLAVIYDQQNHTGPAKVFFEVGGADGIRTHDLLDAIEARSQLRHGPTEGMSKVYHSG